MEAELKKIYRIDNVEESISGLENLGKRWERTQPEFAESWERDFSSLATFLSYPEEIRSSIYTTKTLERTNKEMKRRIKTIEFFSQVKAVEKIIYLVSMELNERQHTRAHRGFIKTNPLLKKMRRERYGHIQNT